MSGAPKRGAHEEGVHLSSSSMRPGFGGEEGENPSFPRVNYGVVQESRPGFVPRPVSRDGERRSPLHSVYKMPVSVTDTPLGSQPVMGPDIRVETRDPKDVRDNKGVESNRDVRDNKGVESNTDLKNEEKVEKDVYGMAGIHSSWKEQHRVKKPLDVPGAGEGGSGSGGVMSSFWTGQPQVRKFDAVKLGTPAFHRKETDENMVENRDDFKGDKERKRKEGKHHDWSESDKDRTDQKSNVQVGGSSISNFNLKEDVMKEKERPEEREKDHVVQEDRSGGEKEMSEKTSMQENFGLEQKKPSESWRNMEREAKERRRERDGDIEGEMPEKRSRGFDKESDKGGADADMAMDRDKDAFGSAVQQRKRMLRPRGNPQGADRDGRLKSRGG